MQKISLTILVLGAVIISAINSNASGQHKLFAENRFTQRGNVQTVYAFRMAGGAWQQGTVTYEVSQYGVVPVSYNFSNYRNAGSGQFFPSQRFVPLNPNNEMAKANHWTHMINSQIGTLYLTIY
jgi:hypothetical protein